MNSLQSIQEFYTGNILNNLSLFLIKNNEKIEEYKQKLNELNSSEHSYSYVINAEWKVEISNSHWELVETIDNISLLNDKLEELNKNTNNKKTAINKQILSVYNENELINEIINKQNFTFTLSSHGKTVEATFDSENPKVKKFLQQKSKTLITESEAKEDKKDFSNDTIGDVATGVLWASALGVMATNIEEATAVETNNIKEIEEVLPEDVLENTSIEVEDNSSFNTTEDIVEEDNQSVTTDYEPTTEELDISFGIDINPEEETETINEEDIFNGEQLTLDFSDFDTEELNSVESPSNEEVEEDVASMEDVKWDKEVFGEQLKITFDDIEEVFWEQPQLDVKWDDEVFWEQYQITFDDIEEVFWEQPQLNVDTLNDITTDIQKDTIEEPLSLTEAIDTSLVNDNIETNSFVNNEEISLDNEFTDFESLVEEQWEETNSNEEISLTNDEFNFDDFDSLVDNSEGETDSIELNSEVTTNTSFDDMELPDFNLSNDIDMSENNNTEVNNTESDSEYTDFDNFDLPDLSVETNIEWENNNETINSDENNISEFDDFELPDLDTEVVEQTQDVVETTEDNSIQNFDDFDDLDLPDISTTVDATENNDIPSHTEDDLDLPDFNDLEEGTTNVEENATTIVHNHYTVAPEQVTNWLPVQQVVSGMVAWASMAWVAATPGVIANGSSGITAENININNVPLELDPLDTSDLLVDANSIWADNSGLDTIPDISQIKTNSSEEIIPNTEWKNDNEENVWFTNANSINVAASATAGAVAMKFISDIKTANKSVDNFSPNAFILKKESFLDKFSTKEKMLWGALIAFLVFAIIIVWALFASMKSTQSELEKKNSELNSKQAEIQNIKKETENAQKEAAKTAAEEEYKKQKITGSSTEGFSLSMIDKIKIEAMEDPNVKADVIANKYLLIRFNSLKPEIGQKLTISFNNGQAPLNYLISKSITGLAEWYNGIVQVIEDEANKTGQNKQFIIITDWNNNFFRANP